MEIEELQDLEKSNTSLVISDVEKIQLVANTIIKSYKNHIGVYVCLNRPQKAVKQILEKEKIKTDKVFFVDCITSHVGEPNKSEGVLHICSPADLSGLTIAVREFVKSVKGKKYILVDALAVLLIYNKEEVAIKFVKSLVELAHKYETKLIMLTQEINKGEFISTIIPFFDKIIRIK